VQSGLNDRLSLDENDEQVEIFLANCFCPLGDIKSPPI